MKPDEYLKSILEGQTLTDDSEEMKQLEDRRKEVEQLLREKFKGSTISIRYGGSKAKGTLIRESYDLDLISYFEHGDTKPGSSLEEIYNNADAALKTKFTVIKKTSALRLRGDKNVDFHVDVVPGRFTDDSKTDAYLHRTTGDKQRLKTNLQVHIDHVKNSGVTDAIKLMKLWRERNAVGVRTFAVELFTIELLKTRKSDGLSKQMEHVLTELRDNVDDITIEDPANPTGNDLAELWSESVRREVSSVAKGTLETISKTGWEAVFGQVEEPTDKKKAVDDAIGRVTAPTKPWCKVG